MYEHFRFQKKHHHGFLPHDDGLGLRLRGGDERSRLAERLQQPDADQEGRFGGDPRGIVHEDVAVHRHRQRSLGMNRSRLLRAIQKFGATAGAAAFWTDFGVTQAQSVAFYANYVVDWTHEEMAGTTIGSTHITTSMPSFAIIVDIAANDIKTATEDARGRRLRDLQQWEDQTTQLPSVHGLEVRLRVRVRH